MYFIPLLNRLRYLSIILILLLFLSCSSDQEEVSLASYKQKKLLFNDALNSVPQGILDTNIFIDKYVQSWLRDQVMLDKAKMYVSVDDPDITHDVREYKERLIVHKYKPKRLL